MGGDVTCNSHASWHNGQNGEGPGERDYDNACLSAIVSPLKVGSSALLGLKQGVRKTV